MCGVVLASQVFQGHPTGQRGQDRRGWQQRNDLAEYSQTQTAGAGAAKTKNGEQMLQRGARANVVDTGRRVGNGVQLKQVGKHDAFNFGDFQQRCAVGL